MPAPSEKQVQYATYIIECDEDIIKNPDEKGDVLEDIRSWALDLARTIIGVPQEQEIRKGSEKGI